jgi:hypothetical protein
MRAVRISEILLKAEEFEEHLTRVYADVFEHAVGEDLKMLAEYMGRHRERITDAISRLPDEQVEKIKKTPLPYEPQGADWYCFYNFDISSITKTEELIDAAITFDDCLIDLYEQVARQAVSQEIKDFFVSLRRMEKNDKKSLKTIKLAGML